MRFNQRQKFRIPEGVVRYLCSFPDPEVVRENASNLWKMGFQPTKRVRFEDEESGKEELVQLAKHIATSEHAEAFIRGEVIAESPKEGPEAEALRQKFLANYKDAVFDTKVRGPPPIRGPCGEATVKLKPVAIPKKQRPYKILGDRKVRFENKMVAEGWRGAMEQPSLHGSGLLSITAMLTIAPRRTLTPCPGLKTSC